MLLCLTILYYAEFFGQNKVAHVFLLMCLFLFPQQLKKTLTWRNVTFSGAYSMLIVTVVVLSLL